MAWLRRYLLLGKKKRGLGTTVTPPVVGYTPTYHVLGF